MEKWTIRPEPTPRDPDRHVLWLKGDLKDVTALIRKFGSVCGRPALASSPDGYNLRIALNRLTAAERQRLQETLDALVGGAARAASSLDAPLPPPFEASPVLGLSDAVDIEVVEPPAPPVMPASAPAPPEKPVAAPTPIAPPAPAFQAPPRAVLPLEPTLAPAPARASRPSAAPPLWGLAQPLDPTRTFETLVVGPYNRFAHAAATSVVSSPGSMYNPLFLYGIPGAGKSHMTHAIGRQLFKSLGADQVLVTSGPRLSRAVTTALQQGQGGQLQAALARAKALLVDDIHLLAVTDFNRAELARAFESFFSRGLQVMLTSIYPPRALGALEEALKISLGKGWSVDVKLPGPTVQVELIQAALDRNNFSLSSEDTKRFHESLGPERYHEAVRWIWRLIHLKRLEDLAGRSAKTHELLAALFDIPNGQPRPSAAELASVRGFTPPPAAANARATAFFLPRGEETSGPWVTARFFQTAAERGIPQSYRAALVEAYDAQQPFGVPFQIGEAAARAGAEAAVVIGPPMDSALAAHEAEFAHAVGHVLESLEIPMSWIRHGEVTSPGSFLRAHLDFFPFQGT